MDAAILEKAALLLPATERAVLIERLMESIDPCPSTRKEQWAHEAGERMEAFLNGQITAVDGPEALDQIRKRFAA